MLWRFLHRFAAGLYALQLTLMVAGTVSPCAQGEEGGHTTSAEKTGLGSTARGNALSGGGAAAGSSAPAGAGGEHSTTGSAPPSPGVALPTVQAEGPEAFDPRVPPSLQQVDTGGTSSKSAPVTVGFFDGPNASNNIPVPKPPAEANVPPPNETNNLQTVTARPLVNPVSYSAPSGSPVEPVNSSSSIAPVTLVAPLSVLKSEPLVLSFPSSTDSPQSDSTPNDSPLLNLVRETKNGDRGETTPVPTSERNQDSPLETSKVGNSISSIANRGPEGEEKLNASDPKKGNITLGLAYNAPKEKAPSSLVWPIKPSKKGSDLGSDLLIFSKAPVKGPRI